MTSGRGLGLREITQVLLDGVVAHFEANTTVGDLPLPSRRLIVAGSKDQVVWDCEQLTVGLTGVGWGSAPDAGLGTVSGGLAVSNYGVRHVVYAVQLVRCTPGLSDDGDPPSAEALMRAGLAFQRDVGLLSQALVEVGTGIVGQLGHGAMIQAGAVLPVGPEGNFTAAEGEFIVTALGLS